MSVEGDIDPEAPTETRSDALGWAFTLAAGRRAAAEQEPGGDWDIERLRELDRFCAELNTLLIRPERRRLSAEDNPFIECDSIELIFLGFHFSGMGIDLPPGIETSITSVAELHEHVVRRYDAENHG